MRVAQGFMITKCLFPVAGYGTRFLPATKAMPKEILPILDKPLVQYGVEEALAAAVEKLLGPPFPGDVRLLIRAVGGVTESAGECMELIDEWDRHRIEANNALATYNASQGPEGRHAE